MYAFSVRAISFYLLTMYLTEMMYVVFTVVPIKWELVVSWFGFMVRLKISLCSFSGNLSIITHHRVTYEFQDTTGCYLTIHY